MAHVNSIVPLQSVSNTPNAASQRRRLAIALALASVVFAVEAVASIFANSLALLAEAFHVLIDVVALAIALIAVWLAERPTNERRTFGLLRLEILATVLNTVLLLVVASVVLIEGLRRFSEPAEVRSGLVLGVAAVGLASNAASVLLLRGARSMAVRAAYLDVLSDLVSSAAVVVSALVSLLAGRPLADTLAAFLIVALIVPRAVSLLREAIDVLLEATPRGMDLEVLRQHVLGCSGVKDIHDLHVWTITSGVNVLSAHVVVHRGADPGAVLDDLETCLRGDFDIEHSTFQLESEDRQRLERAGHP
jgi:cobalt-zinc-cadmium efflux system protein